MTQNIPQWAMKAASTKDLDSVRDAYQRSTIQITLPEGKVLRKWAKGQGWRTPIVFFEEAFIKTMLEDQAHFALALVESGIEIQIPRKAVVYSAEKIAELDALYAERSASGRPSHYGSLVERLRGIRRAVEAGVIVEIESGEKLKTWGGFYSWAHGRYSMLEDGYDSWIGDDNS